MLLESWRRLALTADHELTNSLAVYIHWPFCLSKCPYCDFNSFAAGHIDQKRWKAALRREIEHYAFGMNCRGVASIYFGGGTPSLMDVDTVADLISCLHSRFGLQNGAEITLEANPTSAEANRFALLREAGVNRLSLGVQSFNEQSLRFLGRRHSADEARKGTGLAAKYFSRYSFDIIYGLPEQTIGQWRRELALALELACGHLSIYQLTIEPGTVFHQNGVKEAGEGKAAMFYQAALDHAQDHGYAAYEISNYAKPGFECRHNLGCWLGYDYLGIGPGAHGRLTSKVGAAATENIRSPEKWLQAVEKNGCGAANRFLLTPRERAGELLLTGLRLLEGVDGRRFFALTGLKIEDMVNPHAFKRLCKGRFLRFKDNVLLATASGRLRLDAVLAELLAV